MAVRKVLTKNNQARVKIEGLDNILKQMDALADLAPSTRAPLKRGMRNATTIVAKYARALLRAPGRTGRLYRIEGRAGFHQASAPGEPPAKILGNIVRSIGTTLSKKGFSGRVKTGDPKAHIEEYGSVHQEPRPFLRRALADKSHEVLKALEDGLFEGLKQIFRRRR